MTEEKQHPYLQVLQAELETFHLKYELYNKRLSLIKANNGYTEKSEFEKNEIEIIIMNTRIEMAATKKVILQREQYFKEYIQQFSKDLEECDKNFDSVLEEVKKHSEKNSVIKKELDSVVWENVNKMPEVKVKLFIRMKNLLQL